MTSTLDLDEDTSARLRTLAATGAPAVAARSDLAAAVLRQAATARRRRRKIALLGSGAVVVLAAAAASLPGGGAYFTVIQPSENMAPTVQVGDAVVLSKELVAARGDVVQVQVARDGIEYETVQRVVGMAGDTVECPAQADGTCAGVLVNGSMINESYLVGPTEPFEPQTVPAGQVFLLGDHRKVAVDSRQIGPSDLESLTGVAVRLIRNGQTLVIPGAPAHPAPGGSDRVDPADEVPPAQESAG